MFHIYMYSCIILHASRSDKNFIFPVYMQMLISYASLMFFCTFYITVYSGVWYNTHNGTASEPVTDLRCDESTILNITAPTFIYDIAFLLTVTGIQ